MKTPKKSFMSPSLCVCPNEMLGDGVRGARGREGRRLLRRKKTRETATASTTSSSSISCVWRTTTLHLESCKVVSNTHIHPHTHVSATHHVAPSPTPEPTEHYALSSPVRTVDSWIGEWPALWLGDVHDRSHRWGKRIISCSSPPSQVSHYPPSGFRAVHEMCVVRSHTCGP